MTTVPGHNNILPQSTIAQELNHQSNSPKPSPDQAQAIQQAQQEIQKNSVQGSEASEHLKQKREERKTRKADRGKKKLKKKHQEELALDPEATGRLLDTTA